MSTVIEHFAVGPLQCMCTIIGDTVSGDAIVVDPGDDAPTILKRLERHGLRARHLLHTHAHFDHVGAIDDVRVATGAHALLHPADLPLYRALAEQTRFFGVPCPKIVDLDGDLRDGDALVLGPVRLEVLHTPGHTPGSCSFALSGDGTTRLLSGDTLFRGSVGRWDIGGTSLEDIVTSIRSRLLVYPDTTVVIPGHGPATTIGAERTGNLYLR